MQFILYLVLLFFFFFHFKIWLLFVLSLEAFNHVSDIFTPPFIPDTCRRQQFCTIQTSQIFFPIKKMEQHNDEDSIIKIMLMRNTTLNVRMCLPKSEYSVSKNKRSNYHYSALISRLETTFVNNRHIQTFLSKVTTIFCGYF